MEEWNDIPGFEGLYQINHLSKVKSLYGKTRILKIQKLNCYSFVSLFKNNKYKMFYVHRLTAQVFHGLDITDNTQCALHKSEELINGLLDNSKDNIFVGTQKDNMRDMIIKGRQGKQKKGKYNHAAKITYQYSKDMKLIKIWGSISDITKELGYKKQSIGRCCRGLRPTANGFIWRYKRLFP